MVATDIPARGIDDVGIELVVNYDLPSHSQDYVHRIGRTARAGMPGRAISFATFDQRSDIRDIEKLIRTGLSIKQVPSLPFDRFPRRLPAFVLEQKRVEKEKKKTYGRTSKRITSKKGRRR
jgi:superfamily II DNA/RNA helicase